MHASNFNLPSFSFLAINSDLAVYDIVALAVVFALYIAYIGGRVLFYRWRGTPITQYRFTTKTIAYVTMFAAVSAVATIVISLTIPITVIPPIRVAFEGLMVKMCGYIFGPIIGVLCGMVTDLLVLLFTPSYIHPLYMCIIWFFGFLSGLIGEFNQRVSTKKWYNWIIVIITHLFLLAFAAAALGLTLGQPGQDITIQLSSGSSGIKIDKDIVAGIIGVGLAINFVVIWSLFAFYAYRKKLHLFYQLLPIVLLATITEYLVTVLIGAYADSVFSGVGYSLLMLSAMVIAPWKIIINSTIIYITWRTVRPLINN